MKILIIASEMMSLTGSPMYNYTLALEFKSQGHSVDLYSTFSNNETRNNLWQNGVIPLTIIDPNKHYDLTLISQNTHQAILSYLKTDKIINIVHSEYTPETPIMLPQIDKYIAIRPSIKDHIVNEHKIDAKKVEVIYNGVDFERFNLKKRKKHDGKYVKVVLPCTIDNLRLKFLNYYAEKASEKFRVYIYGHNYVPNFTDKLNKWVFVENEKFDIENYIADADLVAGILLGRINIEAMAMGIKTLIHNPDNPDEFKEFEMDKNKFAKTHNIVNVAKSIIKLYESIKVESIKVEEIQIPEKCESIVIQDDGKTVEVINKTEVINEVEKVADNVVDLQVKKIFTDFYNKNLWGDKESRSGTGSNLLQTQVIMQKIPALLKKYKIKSLLDIPCGDFYWMQRVDLSGIKYIGADIVDDIIKLCGEQYPFEFKVMDIINTPLPKVDMILSRDCLVHLPYSEIIKALTNIKKSGSKYLLTTSFPNHDNSDIAIIGHWRALNLQKEPFSLCEPLAVINENCTENDGIYNDKSMCLFEIKNIII
jgi:hypothetical protein